MMNGRKSWLPEKEKKTTSDSTRNKCRTERSQKIDIFSKETVFNLILWLASSATSYFALAKTKKVYEILSCFS